MPRRQQLLLWTPYLWLLLYRPDNYPPSGWVFLGLPGMILGLATLEWTFWFATKLRNDWVKKDVRSQWRKKKAKKTNIADLNNQLKLDGKEHNGQRFIWRILVEHIVIPGVPKTSHGGKSGYGCMFWMSWWFCSTWLQVLKRYYVGVVLLGNFSA